ncbi:MAG: PAS domain S-box protein [Acholeplasmataceae bacterium]
MNTNDKLKIYEVMSEIRDSFIEIKPQDLDQIIDHALLKIGRLVHQDRAYIFEYDFISKTTSNTYEWCEDGIEPMIDYLQNVALSDIHDFVDTHLKFETMNIPDVSKLGNDSELKTILESQGIQSMVAIPLTYHENLVGFIGFDAVTHLYEFSDFELKVLQEFASILVIHMMQNKMSKIVVDREKKLELIVDQTQIGIWEYLISGQLVYINEAYAKSLGLDHKKLTKISTQEWEKFIHPDDKEKFSNHVIMLMKKEKEHTNFVARIKHNDGHYVTFNIHGTLISDIDTGEEKIYGTMIDITEIVKNHDQLLTFERAVYNNATPIFITNGDKEITFINPMITETLGFTEEDVMGKRPEFIGANLPIHELMAIYQTIDQGESWSGEMLVGRKDGSSIPLSVHVSPVLNEQKKIINYIGTFIDISELKRKEHVLKSKNSLLEDMVYDKISEYNELLQVSTLAFATLTEKRDHETGKHILRVQHLCKVLAEELVKTPKYKDEFNKKSYIDAIYQAASLHDIGKIAIPDRILLKPGKLNEEEWEIMKTHVQIGADAIKEMYGQNTSNLLLEVAENMIRYHHEKWNGAGYLEGLQGEDIPLSARIMSIADAYDAIRSKRPYKEEKDHQTAVALILKDAGTHFDPYLIDVFKQVEYQFEQIYHTYRDE